MANDKVHAAHCCTKHGCKYGYSDCPVKLKKVKQLYPCEYCQHEEEETHCNGCRCSK